MKYWIAVTFLAFTLVACNNAPVNEIPDTLDAQKELFKQKRSELRELKAFVEKLDSVIKVGDPSLVEERSFLVESTPLQSTTFQHYIEVQGAVTADDFVDVSAEVPGRIVSLNVTENSFIQKGQLIAKLDLEATNKQLAELKVALELANTTFERQERLWKQNIGSEMQYLQAKNGKERLEKNIEVLEINLGKANIYAPTSGRVEKVVLQTGELASPGAPIVMLLNTNKLKVEANVPENLLGKVNKRDKVKVIFPAIADEKMLTITDIGSMINPANRTFEIEMNVGKNANLKPNLLANVLINDLTIENAITVPIDLMQQEVGGKNFVYVQNNDRAEKVYIKVGDSYGSNIVVTEGLKAGQKLITKGAHNLKDGALLELSKK